MKPRLIVMVKEPRPGRVKTRLAADIGSVPAAWWYRHQVRRLLRNLRDPRWKLVLAVAPDRAGMMSRVWPDDLRRWPQGKGDLGARMARLLRGGGPLCLIGSDIPAIRRHHVAQAFAALGDHDAVFGPAADGGYWLIGLRHGQRRPAGFLQGVRWSTRHALSDSRATLPGLRVATVETLRDVDRGDDLP